MHGTQEIRGNMGRNFISKNKFDNIPPLTEDATNKEIEEGKLEESQTYKESKAKEDNNMQSKPLSIKNEENPYQVAPP